MVFLFTALGFSFLYHPHFGVLFYPWQEFTAALPWWENLANTLSGNFNLGLMMCWSSALWFVQVTCEGYPFKLIPRQPWRGIAGIIGTFILGLAFFTGFHFLQEVVWGAPVRGAKLIAAVDWRYLHSGEIALFLLLVYLVWGFYFKNWPRKFSTEVNIFVRTVIVGVGTLLFYLFYYKFNAQILGQQAGYSSPMQFPLAATSLIATLTLAHSWFFDMWPGEKVTNRQDFIEKDKLVVEVKKQVNN
jgi:AAT family amino acid transporter